MSPSPSNPKDQLIEVSGQVRQAAADLAKFRLNWPLDNPPHRFLIVHKEYEQELIADQILKLIEFLLNHCQFKSKCVIYVSQMFISQYATEDRGVGHLVAEGSIKDSSGLDSHDVDLIFTMGGDGTVLNAAWRFQKVVPPIMTFHFGTVGFLSMFDFTDFQTSITRVFLEGTRVNIRMRLHCQIYRVADGLHSLEYECNVMNEVVVDRGPSPFMALLDLYGESELLTSVMADGLIIATATGSTAYSMSAGGSVVHPDVPAIMITPICPHTLSLRPFIVPDSMNLSLRVSEHSRSTAWISFDGRHRIELHQGDELRVCCSKYPVTTVCRRHQTEDWFKGLSECLRWNERPGKY